MGTVLRRIALLLRIGACLLAAVPTTLLLPVPLSIALLPRFRREDRLRRVHRMVGWARFCRRHIIKIDLSVEGREHLPPSSRGHIYICNHQSWADILVLMEALDTAAFLAKSQVKWIPLAGVACYAGGSVFVSRDDQASRQRALKDSLRMCKESTAVVVFPEGTRSEDGELRARWHPAAIRAARRAGLKVVPVAIDGTFHVLPKTMDRINLHRKVVVTIGAAMDPADWPDPASWVDAVWGRVTEQFARCRGRLTG
jgi:1-acyl-sn-glycerol-3-phosphate acyltransferase